MNTENTPYSVFSVLEGEQQGLGIVEHENMPVQRDFHARGARWGRASARRKKEETSGRTLYTRAPVTFPTLSLSPSGLLRPAATYSLCRRPWWWCWKGGGTSARWGRALARRKKEEKSGRTLYTRAPVAFPTLSLLPSCLSCPVASYSLRRRPWWWCWKGGGHQW